MAPNDGSERAEAAPVAKGVAKKRDKTINGFGRRKCICENPLCLEIWKFWCQPADSSTTEPRDRKRTGYLRLPLFCFDPGNNLEKHYKNKKRCVFFQHLFPRGAVPSASERAESRSGSKNTWEYVALHHFPPDYLNEDGSGLSCEILDSGDAESLALSNSDIVDVEGHEWFGKYLLAPCYDFTNLQRDFELAGGCLSCSQKENSGANVVASSVKTSRKVVLKPRNDPKQRTTTAIANDMRKRPDYWAIEYQKLDDMLVNANLIIKDLKKEQVDLLAKMETLRAAIAESQRIENELRQQNQDGITRRNLISDAWHRRNGEAAKHFFGGPFKTWSQFKCAVTEGIFPDMEVDGGTGPVTEFEKVMMACMRANRAYEFETIGLMFGVDRRRVGTWVNEYAPKLAKFGLNMSILDLKLDHDYMSKEDAAECNVPHSKK